MTIYSELLTFHPPLWNVTDVATYGGDIDTTATQTTGVKNNEFDDVTNAERITGIIDYRKQFVFNGNAVTWEGVRTWISANTLSDDDTIETCQAGTRSCLGATALLGAATYNSTTELIFSSNIEFAVRPGEWIYDIVNDPSMTDPRCVSTVASTTVTVATAFSGSTTGSHDIGVLPATMFTYSSPATKSEGFYIGDIIAGGCAGVWKRRTSGVDAAPYSNNSMTMQWESD